MTSHEPTESQFSPDPDPDLSLLSPTSARSPMLRARPRLPAGPRIRKQTTRGQREQALLNDTPKDQQQSSVGHVPLPSFTLPWTPTGSDEQLSDTFPSTSIPVSSSPLASQPAPNPETGSPAPRVGLDDTFPSHRQASASPDNIHLHTSPSTFVHSHTHLQTQDHPVFPHPIPIPIPTSSRPATPTPLVSRSSSVASPTLRKPSQATVSVPIAPLTLPSPQIDLAPEPLPYKHLALDDAHWTLTSTELQYLVSSAIRQSAKEQFIRLLPPSIIDTRMPEDSTNIERSWETAAARWRFEAQRRNMLLRALSASGADGDLLSQLCGTLSSLDLHAQNLLHAAAHRTQLSAARDTHRASALAVALRKLNASYARRTRDLDKARANITLLRREVEEAWKVAEEQATEVDKLKAAATETQELAMTGLEESVDDDEDDASSNALPDGASADHTMISRAEVVDVTGKAIAAQARLTVMQTNNQSSPCPPPSVYDTRPRSSPVTSGSIGLQRQPSRASQVSRVSAARKRSKRKSKASLRLPASISVRSRSNVRGESSSRSVSSKSRNRKGKEPAQAKPPVPWIPVDLDGSFLEMEGRPGRDEASDEQVGSDGDGDDDGDGSVCEEPMPDGSQLGASEHPHTLYYSIDRMSLSAAEPVPNPFPSILASAPETQALSMQEANMSRPLSPPLPPGDDMSLPELPLPTSASTPAQPSQRSSVSLLPTSAIPSAALTPTSRPSSEAHDQLQLPHLQTSGSDVGEQVTRGTNPLPDPASIFTATESSVSTAPASAPPLPRRGHSLELPSSSTNGGSKQHTGGSKIRRSISDLLHLGSSSRMRRRSVPLPFKGRGWAMSSDSSPSAIRQDLREEPQGADGLEHGWEDVMNGET